MSYLTLVSNESSRVDLNKVISFCYVGAVREVCINLTQIGSFFSVLSLVSFYFLNYTTLSVKFGIERHTRIF